MRKPKTQNLSSQSMYSYYVWRSESNVHNGVESQSFETHKLTTFCSIRKLIFHDAFGYHKDAFYRITSSSNYLTLMGNHNLAEKVGSRNQYPSDGSL